MNDNPTWHVHESTLNSLESHRRSDETADFALYASIIRRLRAPDGCPWDRKQTLQSLRRYIVEEAFELIAAIQDGDRNDIAEELGDVILVTFLIAGALETESGITISEVLRENGEKLIRRHPHVFGDTTVNGSDDVVRNWNEIKANHEGRSDSPLSVSAGLPPLERAQEIQKKASKLGFDWDSVFPALEKVREELNELETLLAGHDVENNAASVRDNPDVEKEIGDLIFSTVNVARHLKSDISVALSRSNESFLKRFGHIESSLFRDGKSFHDATLEELDDLWNEAKTLEPTDGGS